MPIKKRITKEKLIDLYLYQLLTPKEIAKRVSAVQQTVIEWLKYYNIATRRYGGKPTKERLEEMLKKHSPARIAIAHCAPISRIFIWMNEYGISHKDQNERNWGGSISHGGYRVIRASGKPEYLHRFIMQNHLGRKLLTSEHVHHKNGVKTDNRVENLEIMTNSEHWKISHTGKLGGWNEARTKIKSMGVVINKQQRQIEKISMLLEKERERVRGLCA